MKYEIYEKRFKEKFVLNKKAKELIDKYYVLDFVYMNRRTSAQDKELKSIVKQLYALGFINRKGDEFLETEKGLAASKYYELLDTHRYNKSTQDRLNAYYDMTSGQD